MKKGNLKRLGYSNYTEYLYSNHWKLKKSLFLSSSLSTKINGKPVCFSCKSDNKIHTHHITYDRLGNEDLSDLVYLCEKCHSIAHKIAKLPDQKLSTAHLKIKNFLEIKIKQRNSKKLDSINQSMARINLWKLNPRIPLTRKEKKLIIKLQRKSNRPHLNSRKLNYTKSQKNLLLVKNT